MENIFQLFFPHHKARIIGGDRQEFDNVGRYVITKMKKYGLGFYSDAGLIKLWIQIASSSQRALNNIYRLLVQIACDSLSLLQDIGRISAENELLSLQPIRFMLPNSPFEVDSPHLFKHIFQHIAETASLAVDLKHRHTAVHNLFSKLFSKVELCHYTFSSNVGYVAKVPEFTVYQKQFPLVLFTNPSKLTAEGCVAIPLPLVHPTKMGMIVSSSDSGVFVIYFKAINKTNLQDIFLLTGQMDCSTCKHDMRWDRFLSLFTKTHIA